MSGLGESQLERYSKHLESIDKATKLILLTRNFIKDENIQKYADKYIFWTELYTLIELFTNSISDYVESETDAKKYLLEQFLEFLREENMSGEKVSWEYSKGAVSLINLLKTIQTTLDRLIRENKIIRRGTLGFGFEYTGYYFRKYNQNEDEFWIGIFFNDTNKLFLELIDGFCKTFEDTKFEKFDLSPDNHPTYKYNFDTKHFLAFSRVEQDIAIYNFINDSLDDINKLIR